MGKESPRHVIESRSKEVVTPRLSGATPGGPGPNDRLQVAAVGIGGVGRRYLEGCGKAIDVVSLADLDHQFAAGVFERYPRASRYHDFRRMFDREGDKLDAVIIATPDHMHAMVLSSALALKKHIYCANPITHSIGEARKIRQALLAAPDIVTKASVQSLGTDKARRTTELLSSGVIGPVHELHIWCDHPMYPCLQARPGETGTPPPGMDWNLLAGYSGGNPFGKRRGIAGGLLLPEDTFRDFRQPAKTMPRCERETHYTEWVDCCRTGKKTTCPVEFGCEMTEMGLLGALTLRARRPIQWDAEAMKVTNSTQADRFVDPPYRTGWSLQL